MRIREVGPRDGFQNEPEVIATADKVRLIEMLARVGELRDHVGAHEARDLQPPQAGAPAVSYTHLTLPTN